MSLHPNIHLPIIDKPFSAADTWATYWNFAGFSKPTFLDDPALLFKFLKDSYILGFADTVYMSIVLNRLYLGRHLYSCVHCYSSEDYFSDIYFDTFIPYVDGFSFVFGMSLLPFVELAKSALNWGYNGGVDRDLKWCRDSHIFSQRRDPMIVNQYLSAPLMVNSFSEIPPNIYRLKIRQWGHFIRVGGIWFKAPTAETVDYSIRLSETYNFPKHKERWRPGSIDDITANPITSFEAEYETMISNLLRPCLIGSDGKEEPVDDTMLGFQNLVIELSYYPTMIDVAWITDMSLYKFKVPSLSDSIADKGVMPPIDEVFYIRPPSSQEKTDYKALSVIDAPLADPSESRYSGLRYDHSFSPSFASSPTFGGSRVPEFCMYLDDLLDFKFNFVNPCIVGDGSETESPSGQYSYCTVHPCSTYFEKDINNLRVECYMTVGVICVDEVHRMTQTHSDMFTLSIPVKRLSLDDLNPLKTTVDSYADKDKYPVWDLDGFLSYLSDA